MSISSHKGQAVLLEVEEYAVHHRTNLIVSCTEEGFVDPVQHSFCTHREGLRIFTYGRHLRELVAVLTEGGVVTVLRSNQDCEVVVVNVERERLFGEFTQHVEQPFGINRHFALSF